MIGRENVGKRAKERGGRVSAAVSGKTDFVLVGPEPGSKLNEAEKLQVKAIAEKEFRTMLK